MSDVAVRSGYVDFPWGQVHVRGNLADHTKPPVLLLHQNPLSLVTYENVLVPMAEHFRAVAVDTPGFGGSDAPGQEWTIEEYAGIVRELADRLGMTHPMLVGQHTGACLAIEAALQVPERFCGLVLIGVACVGSDAARARLEAKHPFTVAEDGSHLSYIWHRMQDEQYRGLLSKELATRHVVDHLLAGPQRYLYAYRAVYTYEIQKKLKNLDDSGIPVLLMSGEHDCIKQLHDSSQAYLPAARAVTLPGCSDFIMDEDPESFTASVVGFHTETDSALSADEPEVLYTAVVDVAGGRAGHATSRSGHLELDLARPAQRGTSAGTDPEELFAAGFAACFDSSLAGVARRESLRVGPTRTTASVSLRSTAAQAYSIAVELHVEALECPSAPLRHIIELAESTCPYSKAVRGNIEVTVIGTSSEGKVS